MTELYVHLKIIVILLSGYEEYKDHYIAVIILQTEYKLLLRDLYVHEPVYITIYHL